MAFGKSKPDFLDGVVSEAGPDSSDDEFGATMSKDDSGEDESDPEEAQQDRVMAAKQVAKALGVPGADAAKLADALKAFFASC